MEWLEKWAPNFKQLSKNDRTELFQFTLLWTIFENRLLNCNANSLEIISFVQTWDKEVGINQDNFRVELNYFQQRYFTDGRLSYYYQGLNLRKNDYPILVKRFVKGETSDAIEQLSAILIIIYRFRNNLFHGLKWDYSLVEQIDNFRNANAVLMKILEQKGQVS